MAKFLDVYFYEKVIGQLEQDDHGDMLFAYSSDWLQNPKATPISCSLPLQESKFNRKQCQAFFGGILPEENKRMLIAKNLGISVSNDFSMLEKIGGECAGALSFISKGEKLELLQPHYLEISEDKLPQVLHTLPTRPLMAGTQDVRLSLAGVQDKLAVYIKDEKIYIPLDSSPSTHILKPSFSDYEGVIFNEEYCLKLAKQIGLETAEAEIKSIQEIHYLLIKRYDRAYIGSENNQKIQRIHQEDFCQALGILSRDKYQNEGGPSLKQGFGLIRNESSSPILDLDKLLNAVLFNFLIGNCDAHGKNFSLLHSQKTQLTPLYDLVSTVYYKELSPKMAMKLGGEYNIHRITPANFDKFANEAGLAKPEVRRRIHDLIEAIISATAVIPIKHAIQEGVAKLIKGRCEDFSRQL